MFLLGSSSLWATRGVPSLPGEAWCCAVQAGEGGGCPMLLRAVCPLPRCLRDLGPCDSPGTSSRSAALPQAWLDTLRR